MEQNREPNKAEINHLYYRKLVYITTTLGKMSKFGFILYGINTIEAIINLDCCCLLGTRDTTNIFFPIR
ncbi:hypothetical protein BpHYR1_024850 [Brachionus plicatilis]|uniref:Uncharacterized protein n=1 Tax=Brachionus plicatilis TaxID=10195 RepID=A0A3M7PJT6_BRAPC|nr:hypothetical protein BpHYR1_024850 [Brachionus plicatilis]